MINGCAYCVDMHSKDARATGRIRATPLRRERLAGGAIFHAAGTCGAGLDRSSHPGEHGPRPGRECTALAREHFDEKELVDLTMAIIAINSWNRLAIPFRALAGTYEPAKEHAAG